jgi:hypothetical protein
MLTFVLRKEGTAHEVPYYAVISCACRLFRKDLNPQVIDTRDTSGSMFDLGVKVPGCSHSESIES